MRGYIGRASVLKRERESIAIENLSPTVLGVMEKLGTFQYEESNEAIPKIKKRLTKLENGDLYSGEWSTDDTQHG